MFYDPSGDGAAGVPAPGRRRTYCRGTLQAVGRAAAGYRAGRHLDPEAKEGAPTSPHKATTNGTKARVDLVLAAIVKYGPEAIEAAQVGVTDIDSVSDLDPNDALEYPFGFIIPKEFRDQVVMEMTVSLHPLRTAILAGSISAT